MERLVQHYLDSMSERPLALGASDAGQYRLLHIGHRAPAVLVRIELGPGAMASAKVLDGPAGHPAARVFPSESRRLTGAEASRLRDLIDGSGFWRMQTPLTRQGLDGELWVLEGLRGGGGGGERHVVYRWSPEPDGTEGGFLQLCRYMVEIGPTVVIPPPTRDEMEQRERQHAVRERERADQQRSRDEARRRSNEIALRLAAAMKNGLAVICPHCRSSTNAMRYVDKRPDVESFFVCDRCNRSSTGLELAPPDAPQPVEQENKR